MSTTALPGWLDQSRASLPFADEGSDYFWRHCRMVYGVDNNRLNSGRQCAYATGDGGAHLAFRIGIDGKKDGRIIQMIFEFFSSRTQTNDNNNRLNTSAAHLLDA